MKECSGGPLRAQAQEAGCRGRTTARGAPSTTSLGGHQGLEHGSAVAEGLLQHAEHAERLAQRVPDAGGGEDGLVVVVQTRVTVEQRALQAGGHLGHGERVLHALAQRGDGGADGDVATRGEELGTAGGEAAERRVHAGAVEELLEFVGAQAAERAVTEEVLLDLGEVRERLGPRIVGGWGGGRDPGFRAVSGEDGHGVAPIH